MLFRSLQPQEADLEDPRLARAYAVKQVDTGNMVEEGPYSEDCLYLNVWTSGVMDGKKRPVLVWLHGGGFHVGSGEAQWFDGTNMARRHDAIIVTLNHRLNIFGFFDLAAVAPDRYPDAGCAGLLDITAALRWVHNNIERFGGDPDKVLIFGESGGGGKVNTMMAVPAARGLFHRAISMSGPTRLFAREKTRAVTLDILQKLNIRTDELEKLQDIPAEKLIEVSNTVRIPGFGLTFAPVIDGRNLVCDPTMPESVQVNPDVEMMVGTTHDDARLWIQDYERDVEFDDAELRERMVKLGFDQERIEDAIAAAAEGYAPDVTNGNLYYSILTEIYFRAMMREVADIRSAAGKRMYVYQFDRETPNPDCKASHGSEVPFFFDNPDKAPFVVPADAAEDIEMAHKVAQMAVNFAATGDPNGEGLPHWPAYNAETREMMVFNNGGNMCVKRDHLPGIRKCLAYYLGTVGLP